MFNQTQNNFADNARNARNFRTISTLTDSALLRLVPSAFAEHAASGVSRHYKFLPTIAIVNMLRDAGFLPVKAKQTRGRTDDKMAFGKHMITFQHADYMNMADRLEEIPQVVLFNSHDRTTTVNFAFGLFRFVCENGLIICAEDFGNLRVRHMGDNDFQTDVMESIKEIIDQTPRVMERVTTFKQIELSKPEQQILASATLQHIGNDVLRPDQILMPRRSEDRTDSSGDQSLYVAANIIQENIVKGGLRVYNQETRKTRKTRPVKEIAKEVSTNKAVWFMAEEMAKLKRA
jgi:hypothetical protein